MIRFYKNSITQFLILSSLFLVSLSAGAQNTLIPRSTVVDRSLASAKLPDIINSAGNNRGASFNGEHIFVATRQGGNLVYAWDIKTPDANPIQLNNTGITGGTFTLSDLTTVGKKVYACNMVFATGAFKVYSWRDTAAAPRVLLDFANAPTRLGDAFTVLGDPAKSGMIIASGHGNKSMYVWRLAGDTVVSNTPTVYTYDSIPNMNFTRITSIPGSDMMLMSGPECNLVLLDKDFKIVKEVKKGVFFPSWPMYTNLFTFKGKRYLSYTHIKTSPAENFLYVIDISREATIEAVMDSLNRGSSSFASRLVYSTTLGSASNGNASVTNDVVKDAFGNVLILAYAAGNGFVLEKYGNNVAPTVAPVTTVMDLSRNSNRLPAIIDNSGANRGAGFNGDHVFVTSRQNGAFVYYWDVKNPNAAPKTLDTAGIRLGLFIINDLEVVGKQIFVSNLATSPTTPFKVYKWDDVTSKPTVFLEFANPPARLGDMITITGDPTKDGLLIASTNNSTSAFYVWRIVNGSIPNTTPLIKTYTEFTFANNARITRVPGATEQYLMNGPSLGLALLDKDLNVVKLIRAGTYFPNWTLDARIFEYNDQRLLGFTHVRSGVPIENAFYVVDITQGETISEALDILVAAPFATKLIHNFNLGNIANGNGSSATNFVKDAAGNVWAMSYSAGNGFVVQRFGNMTVNVKDLDRNATFKLYPNPASNMINIESDTRISSMTIHDMSGKLITNQVVNANVATHDISDLNRGLYFISITTANGILTNKLVIRD